MSLPETGTLQSRKSKAFLYPKRKFSIAKALPKVNIIKHRKRGTDLNGCYTTGNSIVDEMAKIRITGNIVNPNWFKTILYENGKPNLNAIVILADIVY